MPSLPTSTTLNARPVTPAGLSRGGGAAGISGRLASTAAGSVTICAGVPSVLTPEQRTLGSRVLICSESAGA